MQTLTAGGIDYVVAAVERDGRWIACASRVDSGDRFGVEIVAPTEADAIERVSRWLCWQAEHAAALDDLQRLERAYHRTIAGSAFVSPNEGPTAIELQKESLEQVEAARVRLDEIRARKPE